LQIIASSATEAELVVLASGCCANVWEHKLALKIGFPSYVHEDNTRCIAFANNMHLRGHSKHIALQVRFIQKVILDGLINIKQRPIAAQTAVIRSKVLPCVPFENFTDQLLDNKPENVGKK